MCNKRKINLNCHDISPIYIDGAWRLRVISRTIVKHAPEKPDEVLPIFCDIETQHDYLPPGQDWEIDRDPLNGKTKDEWFEEYLSWVEKNRCDPLRFNEPMPGSRS